MLYLFGPPRWAPAGAAPRDLPVTAPAALAVYLAAQRGAWCSRESVAAVFWPDRSPADALHALRITLHKLRRLLADWGVDADTALQAERQRLRLQLPSDLPADATAGPAADPATAALATAPWLQGFRPAGFAGFHDWAEASAPRVADTGTAGPTRRTPAQAAGASASGFASGVASGVAPWAAAGAAPEPGPRPSAAAARPPPGRAADLATLRAAAGPAHLLLGEPGLGKSTLLAAAWGAGPGLQGREGLDSVPYAPLVAALRQDLPGLARRLSPAAHGPAGAPGADDALAAYRLDLARLLPELAPGEPLPPLDAQTAKARLMEALCLAFPADGPPLRVDDLQWCDPATVEWLVFAAHRGRPRWRAAARPRELAAWPPAARQGLDALASARRMTRQTLGPLDREAVAQACRQRWPGQDWTDAALAALHAASGGNPFVLAELVHARRGGGGGGGDGTGAGAAPDAPDARAAVAPPAVARLLQARWQALPGPARRLVEAASVLVEAAPPALLAALADLPPPLAGGQTPPPAGAGDADVAASAIQQACAAELLAWAPVAAAAPAGGAAAAQLQCRHDLVRHAVYEALAPARRQALHRRCALALAAPDGGPPGDAPPGGRDALRVAAHWQAAGVPQTALAWHYRGGRQLQALGRFDEARALWQRVADEALEPALALRARLALAEHRLFDDLAEGRAALEAVLDQVDAVAEPDARAQLEGEALAGLVDNAVFAGDIARAAALAQRLRPLLPRLPVPERVHACEVLIELAMREPDVDAARALLQQVQRLAPAAPSTLSFAAQVHWFAGDVRAARDAFEALLQAHPEHRRGLTLENDLAVMQHALGEVHRAEALVRASLATWAGVAHTESLSLLVLGAVLTSAGRLGEADAALDRALVLARQQASTGFTVEALVRRARTALAGGQAARAAALLDEAGTLQPLAEPGAVEPLRASAAALTRLLCGLAAAVAASPAAPHPHPHLVSAPAPLAVLRHAARQSAHPLVQLRLARAEAALALAAHDWNAATEAAQRQQAIATAAGLLEWQAEAQLLAVLARQRGGADAATLRAPLHEAATLALTQGLADLHWRALCGLATLAEPGSAARARAQAEARAAQQRLEAGGLFDAAAAARCAPGWAV